MSHYAGYVTTSSASLRRVCHYTECVTTLGMSPHRARHCAGYVTTPRVSLRRVCHYTERVAAPGMSLHRVSLRRVCHYIERVASPGMSLHRVCHYPGDSLHPSFDLSGRRTFSSRHLSAQDATTGDTATMATGYPRLPISPVSIMLTTRKRE